MNKLKLQFPVKEVGGAENYLGNYLSNKISDDGSSTSKKNNAASNSLSLEINEKKSSSFNSSGNCLQTMNNIDDEKLPTSAIISNMRSMVVTNAQSDFLNNLTISTNQCSIKTVKMKQTFTDLSDGHRHAAVKKIKKKLNPHDPSINNVTLTCSTLKYTILAVCTLGTLALFIFFIIVGLVTINRCSINQHLPIYLIILGFTGITRIILFYTCSYSFSKSILVKMYEHLVWRLIVNRLKASYYYSIDRSLKINLNQKEEVMPNSDNWSSSNYSISSLVKISKCLCLYNFILSFCFCHCQCLKASFIRYLNHFTHENKETDVTLSATVCEQPNSTTHNPAIFQLGPTVGPESSTNITMQYSRSPKSVSIISDASTNTNSLTATTEILNELDCFNFTRIIENSTDLRNLSNIKSSESTVRIDICIDNITPVQLSDINIGNRKTTNCKQMKRSKSADDALYQKQKRKHVEFAMSGHSRKCKHGDNGNRYFYGKYGNNYGTHKRLYHHHNKTHRPMRLLDFRAIRYCMALLIQRCIDIFMLSWFICGNYWVFNSNIDDSSSKKKLSSTSTHLVYFGQTNMTNKTSNNISAELLGLKVMKSINGDGKLLKRGLMISKFFYSVKNLSIINNTNYSNRDMPGIGGGGNVDRLCYHVTFIHVISTYALFALVVVIIICYQLYLAFCQKKDTLSNNRNLVYRVKKLNNSIEKISSKKFSFNNKANKKTRIRSNSLPVILNKKSLRKKY